MCGVTLEPTRPTDPPLGLRSDRPGPPSGLRYSAAADRTPLRSVGLRWALKPRSRPVHYKMTLVTELLFQCNLTPATHLSVQPDRHAGPAARTTLRHLPPTLRAPTLEYESAYATRCPLLLLLLLLPLLLLLTRRTLVVPARAEGAVPKKKSGT